MDAEPNIDRSGLWWSGNTTKAEHACQNIGYAKNYTCKSPWLCANLMGHYTGKEVRPFNSQKKLYNKWQCKCRLNIMHYNKLTSLHTPESLSAETRTRNGKQRDVIHYFP